MNYSGKYTSLDRELLMQKVQMRMSERRFKHVLGVEETAIALAENMVVHQSRQALPDWFTIMQRNALTKNFN